MSSRETLNMDSLDEESLWTVHDIARLLKASTSWVYKAAERGQMPCVRIGALLRFEPVVIREWLAKQRSDLTGAPKRSVDVPSARERG